MTPTQRTMEELRKDGYRVCVVERYIPGAGIRKDMFGFGDLIAIRPGEILAVQCTSSSNHAAHRKKILSDCTEEAMDWLEAGGFIELWSWRTLVKYNKDGRKSKTKAWSPRVEPISFSDLSRKKD